ncbi:hypothetical protein LOAG_06336 [Loa loa]|uniref:Uncharacterized protein n=1 Tax=Loa loa TaxID=7209 RepID=A0A1S0TY11_LOALO|nr:hypothetical protein LOAG_06336 [Loa loa]EFO22153.1 hypothetical protein LOAG_06336 [Loa loa]
MAKITNKIMENSRDMTYSIPPSTADQLLLLPADSACFTPNTSSISSALSFDNVNYDHDDNNGRLFLSTPGFSPIKRKENMDNNLAVKVARTGVETIKSNDAELDDNRMCDSKSAYSLFETEYDIKTADQHKFPDWTWSNHSRADSFPLSNKDKTHASSSFYHLLDMNVEPVDNLAQKLHIPSQYQLEELQNFAPYVNVAYAERTPTIPYLPHTLTRSEYIFGENSNHAE